MTFAILHHTADTSSGKQLAKVNEYHKLRFEMYSSLGYWVGYHIFIEKDGEITKTRAYFEEGAHTKGHNKEAIGICLAGNFDLEAPTLAQLNSLTLIHDELKIYHKTDDFPLKYHFNFSDTHCPGHYFQGNEWKKKIIQDNLNFLQKILLWIQNL